MISLRTTLDELAQGHDLSPEAAREAFEALMEGELPLGVAGALLMGLRAKGETPVELGAAVEACLARALLLPEPERPRIDTCGTGGDTRCSFNCSTATALMLAAMGYEVAKHGNRSISSSCGSADVLEELGFPLDMGPEAAHHALRGTGFAFLFAPLYHPAFRHVMPLRKELGIRTMFNLMGPLLNPARPTHQILGVASPAIMDRMAAVLAARGVKAAVVHGAEGFDELTTFGPNRVLWVADGQITEEIVDPAPLGLAGGKPHDVAVTGREQAAQVLVELLEGFGPVVMQHMLLLNLAVALKLLEDISLEEAAMRARQVFYAGDAAAHFGLRSGQSNA